MKTVGLFVIAVISIVAAEARWSTSYNYMPRHTSIMALRSRHTKNAYLRRHQAIEVPAMSIKRRYVSPAMSTKRQYVYTPARSISAERNARRMVRQFMPQPLSQCPTRAHSRDVLAVIREALAKINQNRQEKLALKKVFGGGVKLCRKCIGGRCTFDHNRATATFSIAPACKSSHCRCGVEPHGKEATCSVTGWTKPHRPAYNIEVDCGRHGVIKPQSRPVEVPARRIRPQVSKTETTTTVTTTEGTTTTLPIVTLSQSDELDIVTDGKGSGHVTLFINTSEETRPAPLLGDSDDLIRDEELLQ